MVSCTRNNLIFVFLLFFCFHSVGLFGCSLAAHEWKLIFYSKFQTNGPIFPFSEADLLLKGEYDPVKAVLWVNPGAERAITALSAFFLTFYHNLLSSLDLETYIASGLPNTLSANRHKNFTWLKNLIWLPYKNVGQISNFVNDLTDEDFLVIGSDNYSLRVALFSDSNSHNKCYQLVLMQEGRIRAVQPSPKKPSANETKGLAYISVIFYENLFKGDILSFSLYPIAGSRSFFIQNEELVTGLIAEKKLLPRLSIENDPNSYDIPELPQ